jgi:hypothetical protein
MTASPGIARPAATDSTADRSEFRYILASGTKTGLMIGLAVIVYLLVSRLIPIGFVRAILQTLIVLAAAAGAAFLPAQWAVARTTQGVASAAAIGLWGTVVFMAIDIVLLRPFKAYPWTWDAVGGGSTWWYLPIWWMLGTFVAWLGGLVTAARARRGGDTAIRSLAISPLAAGISAALGLGLGGVMAAAVAAGLGFTVTLIVFALIATLRRG